MTRSCPDAAVLALAGAFICSLAAPPAALAQPVTNARLVASPTPAPSPPPIPTAQTTPAPAAIVATSSNTAARGAALIGVGGRVIVNSSPLAAAGVYAYQLASLTLHKVETDPQGNFLFRNLPAGLYKIIANKPGFVPAVTLLTRTTAQTYQFLEVQMAPGAPAGAAPPASAANPADPDFWALRASIPPDVLRDIDAAAPPEAGTKSASLPAGGALPGEGSVMPAGSSVSSAALASRFRTELQAMTGVGDVAQVGVGQMSTGKLGIQGQLGAMAVGLSGNFWQMTSDGPLAGLAGNRGASSSSADGQTSAVSLNLQPGAGSRITVDSVNDHLVPRLSGVALEPVGLDHYQVSWSQALGESSRSDFTAQYTNESNYHRQGPIDPADVPDASRTWQVDGSYTTGIGDQSSLQAGFRYSELSLGLSPFASGVNPSLLTANTQLAPLAAGAPGAALNAAAVSLDHQTVDLFSRGSTRLQSQLMVEYGLYTTLQDGSLALTPQGGMVLQLGGGWQVKGLASHRVYQDQSFDPDFLPTLYKESDLCEQGSKTCYKVSLANRVGDNTVTLSAMERIVGQTLRVYFSDAIFDRDESLYLVPGDRLPEVRMLVSRRITANIKTSFESSFAQGGGGVFVGGDGHLYQNQVRYMVSSLDTHFLNSATGIFLAFHHITQDLGPVASPLVQTASGQPTAITYDRLQLMLSQDLNFLWNLAAEWALQVNMELSRGVDPTDPAYALADTQLHRRILGGIAVKF